MGSFNGCVKYPPVSGLNPAFGSGRITNQDFFAIHFFSCPHILSAVLDQRGDWCQLCLGDESVAEELSDLGCRWCVLSTTIQFQ